MMKKHLPQKLQNLVSWSVSLLGEALKDELGERLFGEIEKTRREMKGIREAGEEKSFKVLLKTHQRYKRKSSRDLYAIAHGYALMLELINSCEIAYRTYRVEDRSEGSLKKRPYGVTYVLTAHPTEARSPEILSIFSTIQELLLEALSEGEDQVRDRVFHLLRLSILVPMSRLEKPTVRDEALNIYSSVLKGSILEELVALKKRDIPVYFRAWVGGDKDGHPGVDEKTMVESLQLSRSMIVDHVSTKLTSVYQTLLLLKNDPKTARKQTKSMERLLLSLDGLRVLRDRDGVGMKKFHGELEQLCRDYLARFHVLHEDLAHVKHLLWIFPAMVIPLELREDSELVAQAVERKNMAIAKMLRKLKLLAMGFEPRWYVRGFVLSMVQSSWDLLNGLKLMERELTTKGTIPVVPLFENEHALVHSLDILEETFKAKKGLLSRHKKNYNGRFEVMLGYSDSSKENGVFTSRYLISKTLRSIDKLFKQKGLTPVFFHGSGGSIERGGGSVREQTQWWPQSAVHIFKATIQGEMVARTFANRHLMRRQVEIISSQLSEPRAKRLSRQAEKTLGDFSDRVRKYYSQKIKDPTFLEVIESATPYTFLQHLKIGSRPTKRPSGPGPISLRAIPWILCWTQTRTLFPTWWGVGASFEELQDEEKWRLKEAYQESPLLRSFVKALGFTLAKVELPVWRLYLSQSGLPKRQIDLIYHEFAQELERAQGFVQALSGEKEVLWFRPWLQESIHYRSTMIHPLNIVQLEALRRNDLPLLRETVTGIACGMLTTG